MSGEPTGIKDRNGVEIRVGDMVSLDGNMTADDSMGDLPNGWTFEEKDVFEVYVDPRIGDRKYMNHALSLLHGGDVTVVK